MFKIEELSGSLIKSGQFRQAIPMFNRELKSAVDAGCITLSEMFHLNAEFFELLLIPNVAKAEDLGEKMIKLALRIPSYVKIVTKDEFDKNVKESREAK